MLKFSNNCFAVNLKTLGDPPKRHFRAKSRADQAIDIWSMLAVAMIKRLIRKGFAASLAAKALNELTVTAATKKAEMSDPFTSERVVTEFFTMSVGARNFFFQSILQVFLGRSNVYRPRPASDMGDHSDLDKLGNLLEVLRPILQQRKGAVKRTFPQLRLQTFKKIFLNSSNCNLDPHRSS